MGNSKTTRRGLLPLSGVILDGAAMEIDADSRSTPTFALLLFTFFCPIFHTIFLFKFNFFLSHFLPTFETFIFHFGRFLHTHFCTSGFVSRSFKIISFFQLFISGLHKNCRWKAQQVPPRRLFGRSDPLGRLRPVENEIFRRFKYSNEIELLPLTGNDTIPSQWKIHWEHMKL